MPEKVADTSVLKRHMSECWVLKGLPVRWEEAMGGQTRLDWAICIGISSLSMAVAIWTNNDPRQLSLVPNTGMGQHYFFKKWGDPLGQH